MKTRGKKDVRDDASWRGANTFSFESGKDGIVFAVGGVSYGSQSKDDVDFRPRHRIAFPEILGVVERLVGIQWNLIWGKMRL